MNSVIARQEIIDNNRKEMFNLESFNYCFNSNQLLASKFSLNSLPKVFTNEKRNLAHHSARVALNNCLGQKTYDYEKLEIINHHYLKNWPQFKVSLSHTSEMAMACISDKVESIGIDLEKSDRPLSQDQYKYFKNDLDDPSIEPLKLWIIKEAAYKALSPLVPSEDKLVLGKIPIYDNSFHYKDFKGQYLFEKIDLENKIYFFSIAYLAKE